jgi:copper chaperone CopZ
MQNESSSDIFSTRTLTISGMHCQSCVGRVETALLRLSGVAEATVLAEQKANIRYNSAKAKIDDLRASVEAEGYHILGDNIENSESTTTRKAGGLDFTAKGGKIQGSEVPQSLRVEPGAKHLVWKTQLNKECCSQPFNWFSNPRSYLFGAIASFAIVGVYLGMNTLTADWYFAKIQFREYRWWIITLAVGLGIQVTLFTLFRAQLRGQKMRAAKSSMAASGGVSATAMMACCSHYLATVIPALGVPFLSATAVASLAEYQTYFFLAGVLSCLVGIGLMLRIMAKHGMIRTPILKNSFIFRLGRVGGSG